jgi:GDP-4-dehydro-6-deoxy-D-mannose reductase
MTTAFISGLSGFVGSHLAEYLLDNTDWDIIGMIRWRSPLDNISRLVELANQGHRVSFVYADLRDGISIDKAVKESKPDYVFHLAAQSFPRTSFDSPLDTLETNVQGTVRLLEALRQHSPKAIIHVCSSSEVYGRVPKNLVPIKEDCPISPASPYSISKVGTDLVGKFYADAYGMNIMITRMGTHTGPRRGDVFFESTFAKQIALAEAGKIDPVIKHGNLNSLRTIADVRDAVRAYHMLLTVNPVPGEVYNVAGDFVCTVGDVLRDLMNLSRIPLVTEKDECRVRPIDADNQVFDTEKFRSHTGWRPEIKYEQTLVDLLDYWRDKVKQGPCLQR